MAMTNVYRNLQRRDATWYSIQRNNKVQGYAQRIHMTGGVSMKHASAKQLNVCRTWKRRVCQWLKSPEVQELTADAVPDLTGWNRLCCDPKVADGFCDASTGERVDACSEVILIPAGVFYR